MERTLEPSFIVRRVNGNPSLITHHSSRDIMKSPTIRQLAQSEKPLVFPGACDALSALPINSSPLFITFFAGD